MKGLLYVVALLFSLPNLLAGTASLVLKHTFATRSPLQIMTDFLFQVVWGLPLAALLFFVLLVLGIVERTRPYTALFAFVLNVTALAFVISVFGLPHDRLRDALLQIAGRERTLDLHAHGCSGS